MQYSSMTPEKGGRVQFRYGFVVRRIGDCPELESDPIFFASAGRSFTRKHGVKIHLHTEGVARSDGVAANLI